jgi:DUF1009 family protein
MRFDVPVVGLRTVETMKACRATALAIDAGRTLLFDRPQLIDAANEAGIAVEAFAPGLQGETRQGERDNASGAKSR